MYSAYQLINFKSDAFSDYFDERESVENDHRKKIRRSLDFFLSPGGSVDAAKMMNDWFPDIDANVFISHSRADKDLALNFSGFLRKNGLKTFVDSCVWQHADSLLRTLDEDCCKTGPNLFSYEKSVITASHINIMLTTALSKMMDRCECIFFLNTVNSISSRSAQEMVEGGEDVTHSPWLFHEISMLQLLRKRPITAHRRELSNFSEGAKKSASASLQKFDYPVEISGIPSISHAQMDQWREKLSRPSKHLTPIGISPNLPLDSLYGIVPPHRES